MSHRILVVGAGYAGVAAALRLAHRLDGVLTGRLSAAFKETVARGAAWNALRPGPAVTRKVAAG